jgi:hypothetical protein
VPTCLPQTGEDCNGCLDYVLDTCHQPGLGISLEEALRMNLFSIKTWSLGSDLRSATRTAGAVLAKRGAR